MNKDDLIKIINTRLDEKLIRYYQLIASGALNEEQASYLVEKSEELPYHMNLSLLKYKLYFNEIEVSPEIVDKVDYLITGLRMVQKPTFNDNIKHIL